MKKLLLNSILLLCALVVGTSSSWAEVVSGKTYGTLATSSLPTGWSGEDGGGTSYIKLTDSSHYIQTDNFGQNGFTSIKLKARKFGGPSDAQALIFVSWCTNNTESVLGTIAPTNTTLTDYTISSPVNPAGNTTGYIKIQCRGAGSGKGSGVSEVTIAYTAPVVAVATPTISPVGGAVEKGTSVTLTCTTAGASIYYTTDGTTPNSGSSQYNSAITINSAQTIKAIAIKGEDASLVATAVYTIKKVETPTFSIADGTTVILGTNVELATATEGANIHYTTDGSNPTLSSTTYSAPISIDANMTIKAIAVKANWDDSDIESATYTTLTPIPGLSIDFEASNLGQYVDWEFENIRKHSKTGMTAHGGSSWASNVNEGGNGVNSGYVQTKSKIAYPGTFTCYVSKESSNTTSSSWYIQVSDDGSNWTAVATKSATEMSSGTWQKFSADLSSNSDVYVRLYYDGSTAIRAVDDIVLTEIEMFSITPAKTYTTLTSAKNLDFTSVSSDLKAYIATEVSGGAVQMTQVNKVPAGTGLVLKATTPGAAVNVPVFDGTSPDDVSGNKMAGSATATTAIAENGGYILSDGVFQPATAGTLAAGKAYLNIAVSSARELVLDFDDETTGVDDVRSKMSDGRSEYFNLAGQRVAQPTKGLYIVNGKKYVIK